MDIKFAKVKVEDCDFILKIRNDDSARSFLHNSRKFSKSQFTKWFSRENPEWLKIIYQDKEVGYVRTVSNYPDIEIGMDICPSHRGKGYAKAAYEKLLERLRFKLYRKATLRVLRVNVVAFNLYKRLGFEVKEETENDLYMELALNEFRGKAAKVICTWYGGRRGAFRGEGWTPHHNLEMLKYWWKTEKQIDYGYPMDIFIINNIFDGNPSCANFINSLDETLTKNGRIRVLERENIGASFGAFDFAFNNFKNDYDYWFFLEDDHIILKNGIMSDAVERFRRLDSEIGFYGVVGCQESHCNGGCGVTTRSVLEAVQNVNYSEPLKRGALPFHFSSGISLDHERRGEIPFTNIIKKELNLELYCSRREGIVLSWKQYKHRGIDFPSRVVLHDQRPKN